VLLVVDAGNTNIVFAVHDGATLEKGGWRGIWRIGTETKRTSDEYAVWLLSLLSLSGLDRKDVDRAVIGTVVPAALYHLRRLCRDWFAVEPLIAAASLDWGFAIKMDNPSEVGVDRLVNGMAAHQKYGGPAVVIDFGTATTFDVIDAQGSYCGGVIAPGINLSVEALHMAAARLPRVGIGRPQAVIGRNTLVAMRSGIYWGYVGLIEGITARIKTEFQGLVPELKMPELKMPELKMPELKMNVVATGGLAPLFSEGTAVIERIDPELTLDGLRLLAARNPEPKLMNDRTRTIEGE
jgi:type III pantothenate kinase